MNKSGSSPEAPELEASWRSRTHVHSILLISITVIGFYLCYRITLPFLPAIVWAGTLAVLFAPLQRWLESRGERRGGAAAITVLLIALVVIATAAFIGHQLVREAVNGVEAVQKKAAAGEWTRTLEKHPRLAAILERIENEVDLSGTINGIATYLTSATGSILKGSVVQLMGALLVFYMLFFLLRDRRVALQTIRALSPLSAIEMDRLFVRVKDTIYATVYGTFVVAGVQGVLGGLMFWWLGLPAPLLWGVVMAFLAVVPVLGAFVVWIPAALFLFAEGSWVKGIILTVWGAVVVGTVDNLLRPILVGKRLKLHTLPMFISLLGGLIVFGTSGIILGPVILTITMVLLEIWQERTPGVPKA